MNETDSTEDHPAAGTLTVREVVSLPVTVVIMVASVVCTFWGWMAPEQAYRWLYADGAGLWLEQRAWCVFTSVFLHGDVFHLFFNLYWFWKLGRVLEAKLGTTRHVLLVAGAAWVSGLAEFAPGGMMGIGLSGVVYALFGYILILRSTDAAYAQVLPFRTVRLFVIWFFLCIALTEAGVWNVANIAHGAGFVFGALCGLCARAGWWRSPARGGAGAAVLASLVVLVWAPWNEQWRALRVYRLLQGDDLSAAESELTRFVADYPENNWGRQQTAWVLMERGDYARSVAIYEELLAADRQALVCNNLAWIFATCPDASLRDGRRAVALSAQACELTGWSEASLLNTHAAAHAEAGDFEAARMWVAKAIELDPRGPQAMQAYLDRYNQGLPWREDPPAP